MKKTLKEIAQEMNLGHAIQEGNDNWLNLDERFAVIADERGLHLTDSLSWASFRPITIGRKSSVTRKGLEFQIAQLAQYRKQIGLAVTA